MEVIWKGIDNGAGGEVDEIRKRKIKSESRRE